MKAASFRKSEFKNIGAQSHTLHLLSLPAPTWASVFWVRALLRAHATLPKVTALGQIMGLGR